MATRSSSISLRRAGPIPGLAFVNGVAKITNATGTATLPVATSDKVARGTAWVESGYGATAALLAGNVEIRRA